MYITHFPTTHPIPSHLISTSWKQVLLVGVVHSHEDLGENTWRSTCSHLLSLQRAWEASESASKDEVREWGEHDPVGGLAERKMSVLQPRLCSESWWPASRHSFMHRKELGNFAINSTKITALISFHPYNTF